MNKINTLKPEEVEEGLRLIYNSCFVPNGDYSMLQPLVITGEG
jgi:hypothetical protein